MTLKNKTITLFILLTFVLSSCNPVVGAQEAEPDWSKIDYGVPDDEVMEVYGEPVEVSNVDIVGYVGAGEVHTLTKEQWKEVWGRIIKWKDANGSWPNYVDISKYHVGVDKINENTYNKMHNRWEQWKKQHNGQEPNTIRIEDKVDSSVNSQSSSAEPIQNKLMDAVGTFNTFTEFYDLCKGRKYSFYVHRSASSWYSRDTAIKRLKNRQGLNCVDVSQLGYALAKEMGYDVKFQESYCPKDNVGHVLLKVKGKELGAKWVIVDLAACISVNSKAPLGHHWCGTPHDAVTNWVE